MHENLAARVAQGGHHVERRDVLRRFERGWLKLAERALDGVFYMW